MTVVTVMLGSIFLTSCGGEIDNEPKEDLKDVTVKLDYTFLESGSMSRSVEDVYMQFYNNYIQTKKLSPSRYELDFSNFENTGDSKDYTLKIAGIWGNNDGVTLPIGSYTVKGNSTPKISSSPGCCGDSLWLTFNEKIQLSNQAKNITLNAKYDCFLLLFDAENISSIEAYYIDKPNETHLLTIAGNIYYLFVTKTQRDMFDSSSRVEIKITRKTGTTIRIDLSKIPFEKGKYYYFNDITNSFDIEPMIQGI